MRPAPKPAPAYATVDFGARTEIDAHLFEVTIPKGPGHVRVFEVFGDRTEIERAKITSSAWKEIAAGLAASFNERLLAKAHRPGRWRRGITKLDPLLGKELCVLAWALESVSLAFAAQALTNWENLKPEERWWLFTITAATSGEVDDRLG